MRVLVAGAGPTGLTAAVELARRGVEADVIDRREEGSSLSRAVGIMPRSLELLTPSGVSGRLLAEGMKFTKVRIYRENRLALALPLDVMSPRHGYAFLVGLAQDRTEGLLADAFNRFGGSVRYGTELTGLELRGDSVGVETSAGPSAYDYVIGADGVGSTTRRCLGIDFPGFDLPQTWSIADVDAQGWPNTDAFTLCQLARGQVAVVAPLEANRFRVVSNTEDALATLPLKLNTTNIRREGQFTISVRQVAEYGRDRVFLAGDAAHCHSPAGGRGMNLGIADAAELAERLVAGTLSGYSASRHVDGARTVSGSERVRRLVTSPNAMTRTVVFAGLKVVSAAPALQRRMAQQILYG